MDQMWIRISATHFYDLTKSAVPRPMARLTTFIACTWRSRSRSRSSSKLSCRLQWWTRTISCPMSVLSTFKTRRSSYHIVACVICVTSVVTDLRGSELTTNWCSLLIAPLEETTRTSLSREPINQKMIYWPQQMQILINKNLQTQYLKRIQELPD